MSKKIKEVSEFEWPEFSSESERIKAYSKRYKDMSIAEAFADAYGVKLEGVKEDANNIPKELRIGDNIQVRVTDITKNHVTFDVGNYKSTMSSCVNLHKFERFKHNIPTEPITVKVVDIVKDKVVVDPIAPLVEEWLNPIIKDPNSQKDLKNPKTVRVKDLKLTKGGRGGFTGSLVIPTVSNFVGEDYSVETFIPGSQIVLNITDDFEQFIGKEVEAFVLNFIQRPGNQNQMSLISSAKEYLKFQGERTMIELFKSWCEEGDLWKRSQTKEYEGKVTGIINSSKKCGVFVEIPELKITGMVASKPEEIVNYKPQDKVKVKLTGFDEEMFYNNITKQMQHVEPYIIEDGVLKRCNIKPVLEFV